MMSVKIRMDVSKLRDRISREPERQAEVLTLFRDEGAATVLAIMQSVTPIRTGALLNSYVATMTPSGFFVKPTKWYAIIVERKQRFILSIVDIAIATIQDLAEEVYRRVYHD